MAMIKAGGGCPLDVEAVFKAALLGERERGDGGVVFVNGEETTYRFPREFPNATFRESLQDTVEEAGRETICVVVNDGKSYHVVKVPKVSLPVQA